MLFTIITFAVVLSLLVFVHELGHFWVSRKTGVKVEEFGFGLPPRFCGWICFLKKPEQADVEKTKKIEKKWKFFWGEKVPAAIEGYVASETIYSLNWLPLGGFCKIKGENGDGGEDEDSLNAKPVWKRAAIMSAGVIMNVVLAVFLFGFGYMIGLPQSVENLGSKAIVTNKKIQIIRVVPDTPAASAGLKTGDTIISIDGYNFTHDADLRSYVNVRAGQELDYKISRENTEFNFKIKPVDNNGKGQAGIEIINTGLVRYPWYLAPWEGIKTSVILLWMIIVAFFGLIKGLFVGQGVSADDVGGPVRIAQMTGQYARLGFVYLLQFVGLLSLNLAVINFLPLPALDGGRIIFLLIEKIKGSPVKREVEAIIHNIGFMALLLLILIITIKDISRFTAPLVALWQRIF